jgi:hypothetical protein
MEQPFAVEPEALAEVPRPTFPEEYLDWLDSEHGVSIGPDTESEYASFARQLERQFRASAFFERLPQRLLELHANYKVEKGTALLASPSRAISIDVKSWTSFFEKSYRRNVRDNKRWPSTPDRGWVLPESWFNKIGDIVRMLVVVRYLDGMDKVANAMSQLALDTGLSATVGRLAKVEGYYATHTDIAFAPRVPVGLDVAEVPTSVEIQITTELQANIRDLAHGHYERRRMADETDPTAWQWDYRGAEFSSNYLGHVLHYLEGMIMQLREGTNEQRVD